MAAKMIKVTSKSSIFLQATPTNPRNWPLWRKWSIIAVIFLVDISVSWAASGFSPATKSFSEDFDVSTEVATLGLSLFILGLAIGPMTLAPLSEVGERYVSRAKKLSTLTSAKYFGRSPVYIVSYGVFLFLLAGTALVRDLTGFLVLRTLSGIFSVGKFDQYSDSGMVSETAVWL